MDQSGDGAAGGDRDGSGSGRDEDEHNREDHHREDHIRLAILALRQQQQAAQQPPPHPQLQAAQQLPPQPHPLAAQQPPPQLQPLAPQQLPPQPRPQPMVLQQLPPQPHAPQQVPLQPPPQPHPLALQQVPSPRPQPLVHQQPPPWPQPLAPQQPPPQPQPQQVPPPRPQPQQVPPPRPQPQQVPPTRPQPLALQQPQPQPRSAIPKQRPATVPHPPPHFPQSPPPAPGPGHLPPWQRPPPRLPSSEPFFSRPPPPQCSPPVPSHPSTSLSLSSQEQSLSEQPGPSGLGMAFRPDPQTSGGSSSSASDSSREQFVPDARTAPPEASLSQPHPPANPHPYHVPLSQDPLGVSQGPMSFDLPGPSSDVIADVARQRERQEAERRQREHRALLAVIADYEEREEEGGASAEEEEEETTEESQSEPEAVILPGGLRVIRGEASRQIQAELARLQQHRLARQVRVPGGTESSTQTSSDENPSHARRVRLQQQGRQHAVPEKPGLSLVSRQASGDQEVIATASDSGSSSEPQMVVPTGGTKVPSSRTIHVVPRIGSARMKVIALRRAAQDRQRRASEEGRAAILEQSSSILMTGSSADESHMSDTTAEGGGGAQGDQEVEGEGLPADGTASGAPGSTSSSLDDQQRVSSTEAADAEPQPHPPEEVDVFVGSGATPSLGSPTITESQSELSDVMPDPSHPRLRRPSHQRHQASTNLPPSPSEDEIASQEERRSATIRAGPPDWGARTDASTEYPSTLATTCSSGTSTSDSASVTAMSSGRQSASVDSDHGQTPSQLPTQSSSLESDAASVQSLSQTSSQNPSQTLPVSSTPQDGQRMPPPHHVFGTPGPGLGLGTKKQTSDETTTSTGTSSSSGHLEKTSGKWHTTFRSASSESVTPSRLSVPQETPSQGVEFESLESSPLALDSQTPEEHTGGGTSEVCEVIPGTPPFGEPMQVAPSHQGHVTASQELFQDTSNSQEDLGNQIPKWCKRLSASPEAESQEGSMSQPVKRPRPPESPTSGSDHASSGSTHQPRPKRRRTIGSSASSSISLVPKWKEGSSSRSTLGPSLQAQPASAVEARLSSSRSGSTSEAGGSGKGSGGSGRSGVSGESSSSSSSGNVSTPASSVSHTSSSDISSSGRSSDTASSVGRTLSSETLSGSGTGTGSASTSAGSGGSKGPSSDSSVSQQRHSSSDSSRGETEEGEGEEGARSQRQQETGSLDQERSFSEGSQPSQLLQKPMDPSPGHEGGVSSSGSSSGGASGSSGSASLDTSFAKSQGSQSAPVLASLPEEEEEEVIVIEESVPETGVSDVGDVRPMRGEAGRQQDVASSWQLQLSSSSAGSRLTSTEETRIRSQGPAEQPMSSDTSAPPDSPELLRETSEQPEDTDMQASPAFLAPPPPEPRPPQQQISSTPETPPAAVSVRHQLGQTVLEPMEIDHAHAEVSSQSSFALQLSQSQVFSTPLSGILSPTRTPREAGTSVRQLGTSYGSLEEIEEHERECPNLMETSHASASVSDESVGSQKPRSSESDASMSSGSQSGRGSGSTPPDDGGGGASGGGAVGEGGGNGGDGRSGSESKGDGGSRKAGGEGSEGAGRGKGKSGEKEAAGGTDAVFREDKQPVTLVSETPSPDVPPAQPSAAALTTRPVPMYESIRCDSSSPEDSELSASRDKPLQNPLPSGSATVATPCQTTAATAGSQLRSSESQHSLEVSELTPSGTSFRLQLPQGALLKPLLCITPPSQPTPRTSQEAGDIVPSMRAPRATIKGNNGNNNGGISMFSPSEVSASFLRSATPSESQQDGPGSQSQQGQPLFLITGRVAGREGASDSPSVDGQESLGESQRSGQIPSQVTEPERESGGPTASNSKVTSSQDSSKDSKYLKDGEEATSQAQQSTAPTELSKDANTPGAGTCRERSVVLSSGSEKATVHVDSSVSNRLPSCDVSEAANVRNPTPVSPRKSLSLRKIRTPPAKSSSRRRIIPNGALVPSDNFNRATPNVVAATAELKERTVAPVSGRKTPGFVLSVDSPAVESQMLEDSQFVLPAVNVPSDSQFDSSQGSEFSLNHFRIERPPAQPMSVPPASLARRPSSPPSSTSIFSNARASKRVSRLPPATIIPVLSSGSDPYEFHSQCLGAEPQEIGRRGIGRQGELEHSVDRDLDRNAVSESGGFGTETRSDVDMTELSDPGDCENEGDSPADPERPPSADANTDVRAEQGSREGAVRSVVSETQPASSGHDETAQMAKGSSHVPPRQPQQRQQSETRLVAHHHREADPSPRPPTPPTSPRSHTPPGGVPSSATPLPFTSPSLLVVPDYLQQLTQQYGVEGRDYELRHVRTFKTVVERRLVSVEVKKGDQVLDTRVFVDDSQPQYSHSDSIEAAFYVPSAEAPTVVSIPACVNLSSPAPSSSGGCMPPPTLTHQTSFSSYSALLQSPIAALTSPFQFRPCTPGGSTPQFRPPQGISPIRLVRPACQVDKSRFSQPSQPSEEQPPVTATASCEAVTSLSCEEDPIPPGEQQWQRPQGGEEEAGGTRLPPIAGTGTRKEGRRASLKRPPVTAPGVHTRSKKRQVTTPTATPSTSTGTSSTGGTLGTPSPSRGRSAPSKSGRRDAGGRGTGKRGAGGRGEGTAEGRRGSGTTGGRDKAEEVQQLETDIGRGSSATTTPSVAVGAHVMAKWRYSQWYPATITAVTKGGRLAICYADEQEATVLPSNVFPLHQVKPGVSVRALEDEDLGIPEARGLFIKFVDSSLSEFYLGFEEGGIECCATGRMTLNSAAAQACLKKPDVDNMSPVPSRKRSASSSSASGERSSQLPASKRRKASSSPRAAATIEAEEDVPPPQRALFEGYTFLLTQRPKDDKQCTASPPPEPVDRALIGSQLRNRRGRVLDSYGGERIISNRFFVLSDTYCRTSKYLMGLALGVPPLSYTWVAECIREGCIVDYTEHLLPAGYSHETKGVVPWEPRCPGSILQGMCVHLQGADKFKQHWTPILQRTGASVCPKLPSFHRLAAAEGSGAITCDVVICEATEARHLRIPNSVLHRASTTGMKLLTTEWLIQCLIHATKIGNDREYLYQQKS